MSQGAKWRWRIASVVGLVMSGFFLLGATAPEIPSPGAGKEAEISQATQELRENLEELRKNLRSLRKIGHDQGMDAQEKRRLLGKAKAYARELEEYQRAMQRLNSEKLSQTPTGQVFLRQKREFDRELENFRQELQKASRP